MEMLRLMIYLECNDHGSNSRLGLYRPDIDLRIGCGLDSAKYPQIIGIYRGRYFKILVLADIPADIFKILVDNI